MILYTSIAGNPGVESLIRSDPADYHVSEFPVLFSFAYHRVIWGPILQQSKVESFAVDSGAFTAHRQGKPITLDAYCEFVKGLNGDPRIKEIYALDVIGDWKASLANTKQMWKQGIEAIPCWHVGEPIDLLKGLARDYPKIAIGGFARRRRHEKMQWLATVFAAVWPCRIHAFGLHSEPMMRAYPLESVDASSWTSTVQFNSWTSMNRSRFALPGAARHRNVRAEVASYVALSRDLRTWWKARLGSGPDPRIADARLLPPARIVPADGNAAAM